MATPHSADGLEPLEAGPRGHVIIFPAGTHREGVAAPTTGTAQILFFTGVRYERHATPVERKSPRREVGPRRQA